jgi:hypothetical protein
VGDLDDAERAGEHWQRMATVVGRTDRPEQLAYAFTLRLQQGAAGELPGLADQLLAYGDSWMGFTPLVTLHDAGRHDDARDRYQSVAADAFADVSRRRRGVASANLAFLAALLGDREGAQRWSRDLEPVAEQLTRGATVRHCAAHYLAMAAAVTGDDEAAHRWFETAVRVHESASAALLAAETRLEWARYCASIGQPDRAHELAEEARDAAIRRRSSGIDGQARALLSAIDRRQARKTRTIEQPGPDTLGH